MVAMRPLKERLASKDIVFIYLTGPSSPMANWKQDLEKMNGVHYRLSEAQWKYLCQSYGITGIPGYLIISHDGKLQGRYVASPEWMYLRKICFVLRMNDRETFHVD